MYIFFRGLRTTHHAVIAPCFGKTAKYLFKEQLRYKAHNLKYASTAKFPNLIKDHPEIKNHEHLHKFSIENPEKFWDYQAKSFLTWYKPYSNNKIMNCDMKKGIFKWFEDGQLNASVNCVDR